MSFTASETKQVDWIMRKFFNRNRPPERARHQVDLSYEIKNQSVEIFLLRSFWRDTTRRSWNPLLKPLMTKTQGNCKIYWQRADMKWHTYEPHPEAPDLETCLQVVEKDPDGCFWG